MIQVRPSTITFFADIGCPWAHLAVHRLHAARARGGLEDAVAFDARAFPLELFNSRPTPRGVLDAEIPVAGGLDPEAGFSLWSGDASEFPVTTLPAMEAVYAAKAQDLGSSDRFDRALRQAFFRDSRCISMHHVILDVAGGIEGLDAKRLEQDLVEGTFRHEIFEDQEMARRCDVQGSPHLFLPDGSDVHNPGVKMHWEGGSGGFPVIEEDDPDIYDGILQRAAGEG